MRSKAKKTKKTKKTKNTESSAKVYIKYQESYDSGGGISEGEDPDDRYAQHDTEYVDFRIRGATFTEAGVYYEQFDIPGAKLGDTVYVTYGIYSTGDTFSHTEGRGHITGAFLSLKDTKDHMAILRYENESYCDGSTKDYYHRPWFGYFESLTELKMEPVVIL